MVRPKKKKRMDGCYLPLYSWFLAQCLAYGRCSINVCKMNEIDRRKILTADNNAYLLTKPKCFNLAVPPLLSGNDFQTAEEGSDVKLVCNVKSNPQAQMMWYKNNGILNLENHHQIQQTSKYFQLSITKVKKSDNGTYSCIANSLIETKTKDFHLIVKGNSRLFIY